jgi:hypothetical protein
MAVGESGCAYIGTDRIQFFQIPDSITVEDSSNSDALQFTSTPTRYVLSRKLV